MQSQQQSTPMRPAAGQKKMQNRPVKAFCKKDLVNLYGITYKTLAVWLKPFDAEIGALHGKYFNIAQMEIIFDRLGCPGE